VGVVFVRLSWGVLPVGPSARRALARLSARRVLARPTTRRALARPSTRRAPASVSEHREDRELTLREG